METDAALLSRILHALADVLEHDLTRDQQALVIQATKAALELRRRNHEARQTKDTPALPHQ